MERGTSGKVDKLEHVVHIVRLPGHLLRVIRIGSGSAHGGGEFRAGEGEGLEMGDGAVTTLRTSGVAVIVGSRIASNRSLKRVFNICTIGRCFKRAKK